MKREDLRASFDRIKPDESAKNRMLDNIMNQYESKKGIHMLLGFKRAIPALALAVVILGGLMTYKNITGNSNNSLTRGNNSPMQEISNAGYAGTGREDAAAPILDQFRIGNRYYILLSDELREDFGLPAEIDENDIGKKLTEIEKAPDPSLIGCEVYSYIPAGGEAIVAIKKDNEYRLFRFFTFESYNNNQDEDAIEYLKLYGINNAEDMAKIQFIIYSERSKIEGYADIVAEITDRVEINSFYSMYSVLKNSSDKYFESLFNSFGRFPDNRPVEIGYVVPGAVVPEQAAPDRIGYGTGRPLEGPAGKSETASDLPLAATDDGGNSASDASVSNRPSTVNSHPGMVVDTGIAGSGSVEPGSGSVGDALANPVTIRIYNKNGIYYDSPYYRNIGFISRYEASEELEDFIAKYLNQ